MSHEKLFFKKTLDASSNTIWNELKNIRESTEIEKRIIRRRWIWELIQNASDCTPKDNKVNIKVDYSDNQIIFTHDGLPFSYENLLDLITQISSKQSSEEKKTGKFGTGFMSTHLLSDIVKIQGSLIQDDGKYSNLDFTIDRSGYDYVDIKSKTKIMLEQLDDVSKRQVKLEEEYEDTKFIYSIADEETSEAVKEGIEDLIKAIPYILIFNENINSITYNGNCFRKVNERTSKNNNKIKIIEIKDAETTKELLILNENNITIACEVEFKEKDLCFLPIPKAIPKVFCDFPLVGTEEFSFPIVVNSSMFEVERDRNAIRDSNTVNEELIKTAISLHKELLNYCAVSKMTRNEFNICMISPAENSVIQAYSYKEIKKYIERIRIVPINSTDTSRRLAFIDAENDVKIGIPKTTEDTNKDILWDILADYKGVAIPTRDTYLGWAAVFGENIGFSWINDRLKELSLDNIDVWLKEDVVIVDWLNRFYSLWLSDLDIDEVKKLVYVPNQSNKFVAFDNISLDQNIDDELKKILILLGEKVDEKLLNQGINSFKSYFEENENKVMTNEKCSNKIDLKVSELLGKEAVDRVERKESTQRVFNRLTNWFLANSDHAKEWFEDLYSKRMMLSSPEENLRRYKIAEKIEENNIKYEELDEIINNRDIVLELISSSDLSKEDIIKQLKHITTSTAEMKRYVEEIINRSIENVYKYLEKNRHYDLSPSLDEWLREGYSETVFPAKFQGKDIRIIIRPSDSQKIIFYYDEELEALDDYDYQLWTDDGEVQRMVTLGDLLKTTGISRIPLTKI